jgi:hypothetical protein
MRFIFIILLSFILLSCSTIDSSNYRQLDSATETLVENSETLLESLSRLEKENYIDAVLKEEKDVYDIKYNQEYERDDIFLDQIYEYNQQLTKINNLLKSYTSLLLHIASNEVSQLEENTTQFFTSLQSIQGVEVSNSQIEILSNVLNEIERNWRADVLEEIIKMNQNLVEQFSEIALEYIDQLEDAVYFIYDKRFADVYENFIIEKNPENLEYLFTLNETFRQNINYIQNIRRIYSQISHFHKNIATESGILQYVSNTSEYYFEEDLDSWMNYLQR